MVAIPPKDFIEEKDYENQYCSRCTVLLSQLLKEVINLSRFTGWDVLPAPVWLIPVQRIVW